MNIKFYHGLIILACIALLLLSKFAWYAVFSAIAAALALWMLLRKQQVKYKKTYILSTLLLTGISCLFYYLFPVISIASPTGQYNVGITYRQFDTKRADHITDTPNDYRTLYLKIWYPSNESIDKKSTIDYMEGGKQTISELVGHIGLPGFPFYPLLKTKTNSYLDLKPATEIFPLVTFSHGYGLWPGSNTALMEELASHGNVVVSIAHTYGASFGAVSSEEAIVFDTLIDFTGGVALDSSFILSFTQAYENPALKQSTYDSLQLILIEEGTFSNYLVREWALDIQETIAHIISLNGTSNRQFPKIDTARIAATGMSMGGIAAVESTLLSTKIKGALNMDGTQYGSLYKDTSDVPLLFFESDLDFEAVSIFDYFLDKSTQAVYRIKFKNAKHYNFTDASHIKILKFLGLNGEADASILEPLLHQIVLDYLAFLFDPTIDFDLEKYDSNPAVKSINQRKK